MIQRFDRTLKVLEHLLLVSLLERARIIDQGEIFDTYRTQALYYLAQIGEQVRVQRQYFQVLQQVDTRPVQCLQPIAMQVQLGQVLQTTQLCSI